MAIIQRNSAWHDKNEVRKGDYGEELVRRILEQCGFVVYQAITEKAHLIDFIVELDKNLIFAVDVKTKRYRAGQSCVKSNVRGFNGHI